MWFLTHLSFISRNKNNFFIDELSVSSHHSIKIRLHTEPYKPKNIAYSLLQEPRRPYTTLTIVNIQGDSYVSVPIHAKNFEVPGVEKFYLLILLILIIHIIRTIFIYQWFWILNVWNQMVIKEHCEEKIVNQQTKKNLGRNVYIFRSSQDSVRVVSDSICIAI